MHQVRYKLDENSPIPLYYQLKEIMRDYIMEAGLKPGDRFPSERELIKRFPVSRMTLRQALNELVSEGLLVRKRGRGTFVAPGKMLQGLHSLTSFSEDMYSRGLTPSSRILSVTTTRAGQTIAAKLDLPYEAELIRIERLRLADGTPMALETSHLEARRFRKLQELLGDKSSLYSILRRHFGVKFARAEETLEAVAAKSREASLLDIEKGAPVLFRERITYEEGGNPVEYVQSLYRADRYKFRVELVL